MRIVLDNSRDQIMSTDSLVEFESVMNGSVRRLTLIASGLRQRERGFTLLELLVVIAILGMLVYMVAPAALRQLGSSKQKIAQLSIERLVGVLDSYKLDVGNYPTTDQGLQALVVKPDDARDWSGPYIKTGKTPEDPWGHPYLYRSPSTRAGHDFDLCSAGPNAQPGQASLNPDSGQICNQ